MCEVTKTVVIEFHVLLCFETPDRKQLLEAPFTNIYPLKLKTR